MRGKKIIAYSFFILFCGKAAQAQVNDAQLWENINIEKSFSPKVSARVNQEARFVNNISNLGFNYFDFGVNYKFSKHIHATVAYVWVEKQRNDESWSPRHQAYLDLTFRKKFGGFLFTDRQMVQWQVKDYFVSADGRFPEYYLRNKVTIKWDKTFRFQPYVAEELYFHSNMFGTPVPYRFNRIRYFAGLFYHPDQANEFEMYYMHERHFNEANPSLNWVIGLGYAHSF
jgi:hypothetical protein